MFTRRSTGLTIARTTMPTFTDDRMRTKKCTRVAGRAFSEVEITGRNHVISVVRRLKWSLP